MVKAATENPPINNFGRKQDPLTQSDLANLRSSFIDAETAASEGIYRCDDIEGCDIVGRTPNAHENFEGMVFLYRHPDEPQTVRGRVIRRDKGTPYTDGNGNKKEKMKYARSKGTRQMLYFVTGTTPEMLSDVTLPIVYCEGEKKAIALARVAKLTAINGKWRFLPIALSGVDNFTGQIGIETDARGKREPEKGVISDLRDIPFNKKRPAYLLPDTDVFTNPKVKNARYRLSVVVKEMGAKVKFIDLPADGLKGVDDVLGDIENREGIEVAKEFGLNLIASAYDPKKRGDSIAADFELVKAFSEEHGEPGVWHSDGASNRFLVCSPLDVVATTRTGEGENYGKLLEWRDREERLHRWAMPVSSIHGESSEVVQYLASRGLQIGTSRTHYDRLKTYINLTNPERMILCADKLGWFEDKGVYLRPDETIGESNEEIVYQPDFMPAHKFGSKGTLEDWQENISKYCLKNPRLLFVVSVAFAAALLPILEVQSGGFHLRAKTSKGKTSLLFAAGSVYGGHAGEMGYCQTWKTTANGLESIAEIHNHALLCLDELGQMDAKQAGDVAYMLGNGEGKKRMTKGIAARRALTWQLLFLSTGEISLEDKMKEAGQQTKGGQDVRLLDIPVNSAYGVFDHLHHFADGAEFSNHLRSAARKFYGEPIRAFVKGLAAMDRDNLKAMWRVFESDFKKSALPTGKTAEQIPRAAERCALVAFAGQLATQMKITGWSPLDAKEATVEVFQSWLSNLPGHGGTDDERAVKKVRKFLEENGSSRFEWLNKDDDLSDSFRNTRAGYRKAADDGSEYYIITVEVFNDEVTSGFNTTDVCRVLSERGFLEHPKGLYQKQFKVRDDVRKTLVQKRGYWIKSSIFTNGEDFQEEGE